MMTATFSPGQIYLADQRGLVETAQQQRLSTFNFGIYSAEGRDPFGSLRAVNEESLAPGQAVTFAIEQATYLVLLPVVGAVTFLGPAGLLGTADVEQVQVLALPAGTTVQLRNPYSDAVVTFLHLWLNTGQLAPLLPTSQGFTYSFEAIENQLTELVPAAGLRPFALHLGRFAGRHEALHQVPPGGRLFAFVLAGAFELEGRLLHAKDGLALWDCPAAELEALSNNALVLLVELL